MEFSYQSLWQAFQDGYCFESTYGQVTLTCQDAGYLRLPTGRILVGDTNWGMADEPLSVRVKLGEYPVYFAVTGNHEVALWMVTFKSGEPRRWAATQPPHFSVDSAEASILDAKLARWLVRQAKRDRFDRYRQRIESCMEENDRVWANVCLHEQSRANIIACRTLGGDGTFNSYLGYSKSNELLCLITDFFLADLATD